MLGSSATAGDAVMREMKLSGPASGNRDSQSVMVHIPGCQGNRPAFARLSFRLGYDQAAGHNCAILPCQFKVSAPSDRASDARKPVSMVRTNSGSNTGESLFPIASKSAGYAPIEERAAPTVTFTRGPDARRSAMRAAFGRDWKERFAVFAAAVRSHHGYGLARVRGPITPAPRP